MKYKCKFLSSVFSSGMATLFKKEIQNKLQ